MNDTTDAELVRRARNGQPGAYEQLVRRWSGRVLALCHARVGAREPAEDLAQETLMRGLQKLDSLKQPHLFGYWLRGIALRVCLDWVNSRKHEHVPFSRLGDDLPESSLADETEATAAVEEQDDHQRLVAEVEKLPDQLREVVMLYYYEDVTYQEIADLLGVSRATVNARLAKARSLLSRRLASLMR